MAESPSGYWPDFRVQFDVRPDEAHFTEILVSRSLREQRRAVAPSTGRPRWTASSEPLEQADRKTLYDHIHANRGRYGCFYFFDPIPQNVADLACGSVSGSATFVVPFKGPWRRGETAVAASITGVKVGGVSKAFTIAPNVGSGGEDQVTFTAGVQTGAVTVTGTLVRLRWPARYDSDTITQSFVPNAGDVRTVFPFGIQGLI